MSYRVKTENFEGPFDLLLELVNRQKVDIGSIAIAAIADQYLDEVSHMDNLDLEVAGDFLVVASTLLEIKAQSLLPRKKTDIEEEFADLAAEDARAILIERLLTYKQYKNASTALAGMSERAALGHGRSFGPDASFLNLMPDYLEGISLDALALLCAKAMARKEVFLLESEHIAAKPIPVELHVRAIYQRIRVAKNLRFSQLITKKTPTPVIVVTFLAILELYKRGVVTLQQEESFGDIAIAFVEGSEELSFEGDKAIGKDEYQ